jgi:hypothetical protein
LLLIIIKQQITILRAEENFISSTKKIYMSRRNNGIDILNKTFPSKTFRFLGEGKSSVIFTDETLVYKVFLLENYEALGYKRNILSLIQGNKSKFDNSDFFYSIQQIIEINKDCFILIYPLK